MDVKRREFMRMGAAAVAAAGVAWGFGQTAARAQRATGAGTAAAGRPNILVILADDLGYSDLGCYGGEIATPNLDKLAAGGLRFTEFYNCARCCPSRAALLTGLNPHQAGVGLMTGNNKKVGYEGHLTERCVTLPEVLKQAGYRTFHSGKWHLATPGPIERGFDEYYGFANLNAYGVDCFNERAFTRLPAGRPVRKYKAGEFYATDAIADHALDFLGLARETPEKPWFMYVAFNAPHFPLQAPEELIEKYEKVYAEGWDGIRAKRLARMKEMGVPGMPAELTPREKMPQNTFNRETGWVNKVIPAWDSLDEDRRADLARRMAVYAAMVERLDQAVGRIVEELKKAGQLENTMIVFTSDNGACAEWDPLGFDGSSGPKNVLHKGADLKKIGRPGSYNSYGTGWANACDTPWRLYKHFNHEGGIAAPLVVHWPAGIKERNVWRKPVGHLIDLMPTCLAAAGAGYPAEWPGRKLLPVEGKSLLGVFAGEPLEREMLGWEHEGNRALRVGKWKLVSVHGREWELYDMETDRTEQKNLAEKEPERVKDMAAKWEAWAARTLVK